MIRNAGKVVLEHPPPGWERKVGRGAGRSQHSKQKLLTLPTKYEKLLS